MNHIRSAATIAMLCLPLLTACSQERASADNASGSGASTSALGAVVENALDKARTELATETIDIRNDHDNLPEAGITPAGDLFIDGKQVAIDARQRALLLEYRASTIEVAEAGMKIGVQGADFGMKAAAMAIRGALSGNSEEVEQRIEAEAEQFEAMALDICDHLQPMLTAQQQLAEAIPEFAPYATMSQDDIEDCRDEGHFSTQ